MMTVPGIAIRTEMGEKLIIQRYPGVELTMLDYCNRMEREGVKGDSKAAFLALFFFFPSFMQI